MMTSSIDRSTAGPDAERKGKAERVYWPELDALRFFAFALVFCSHAPIGRRWYAPLADAGSFGVSIFFCLSAFLIITLLLKERAKTGRVRLGAFAVRRVLRIWPPYFAVVAIAYAIGTMLPSAHISRHAVLAMCVLLGNVFVIHHGWNSFATIAPLWSISLEEQFYLGIPFLTSVGGRRALLAVCSATIAIAYLALWILGSKGAIPIWQVWANSFVQFQFFAAGGLLALFLYEREVKLNRTARLLLGLGGLVCFYVAGRRFGIHSWNAVPTWYLIVGYMLVLAGTSAILIAMLNLKARIPSALVYLGKISYGLYLVHMPIFWLLFDDGKEWPAGAHFFGYHRPLGVVIAMVLTLGIASLSYRYFERPILRLKNRFETVKTRPA